jgi:hypothetical protein
MGYVMRDGQWIWRADPPGGQGTPYTYSPPGAQAPVGAYNYQQTQNGSTAVYPPGVRAPNTGNQTSARVPMSSAEMQREREHQRAAKTQVAPHQINAENYNNMNPYNRDLLWSRYEDDGWDVDAAKATFMSSLPRYGGAKAGRISGVG